MTPSTPAHASRGEGETPEQRVASGIAYAIARTAPVGQDETGRAYADRLAPLVIESGWLAASPAPREEGEDACQHEVDAAALRSRLLDIAAECDDLALPQGVRIQLEQLADDLPFAARTSPPAVDVDEFAKMANDLEYVSRTLDRASRGIMGHVRVWSQQDLPVMKRIIARLRVLATPSQDTPAREEGS